jgi:FdrA protein
MSRATVNATRPFLISRPVKVVNIGLERFAKELESQSVPVVQVAWAPPAGGDARLAALLAKLGS